MTRLLVLVLFNVMARFMWDLLRAIGKDATAALRHGEPGVLSRVQGAVRAAPTRARPHCGQCGSSVDPAMPFCPGCGLAVHLESDGIESGPLLLHRCRTCGAGVDLTDRYCTACGSPFSSLASGGEFPAAACGGMSP